MSLIINIPKKNCVALTFPENLSKEEFWAFCSLNPDLIVERERDGQITIISPVGFKTGERENILNAYLTIWAIENGLGTTTSPSTGFTLPSGEVKSSDASWISDDRLNGVEPDDLDRFPELVPDFIVEIRSKSDNLKPLQRKMQDAWMANGVRLGWLIDVKGDQVFIYRADGSVEVIAELTGLISGEDVLPGFGFDLNRLRNKDQDK